MIKLKVSHNMFGFIAVYQEGDKCIAIPYGRESDDIAQMVRDFNEIVGKRKSKVKPEFEVIESLEYELRKALDI